MTQGHAAPEVGAAYARAHVLCQRLGNPQSAFPALVGLWRFYNTVADLPLARQLGDELLSLAERRDDAPLYVMAHYTVGTSNLFMGELRNAPAIWRRVSRVIPWISGAPPSSSRSRSRCYLSHPYGL